MNLAGLTTLRVGGEAATVFSPATSADLVAAVRDTWASGVDWLVLGGGSNVVIGDDDFDGTVIRVLTRGIDRLEGSSSAVRSSDYLGEGTVRLRIAAGEPWDAVVEYAVSNGLAGIEALSGIPGSSGAAPIQNIGAYGQEIGTSLVSVEFLDYLTGEISRVPAVQLGLGYRTSVMKQGREGVVLSIDLELAKTRLSAPIAYAQLAGALGVRLGDRVPLDELRTAVLSLRASKGMLWDESDPDSFSAGSFFTNPIVTENFARQLPAGTPRWPTSPVEPDIAVPLGEQPAIPERAGAYHVKLSAAWLIEHAGVTRGFSLPGSKAAISSKHTLALVNTGGASAYEVLELARYVQTRVYSEYGIHLHAEPVIVNTTL
jgi:UDP-N-acetylmuramate dehydrogenase